MFYAVLSLSFFTGSNEIGGCTLDQYSGSPCVIAGSGYAMLWINRMSTVFDHTSEEERS